jgi:uncharacterized protein YbcV (DUF1398 family)
MNLDIEGTKHEKVVIIVLSYVIGFTAGFICFGVAQSMRVLPTDDAAPISLVATEETPIEPVEITEADIVAETSNEEALAAESNVFTVTYTDDKLQVTAGDNTYLLSMKSSGLDSSVQSAFKNQGLHTDIPAYSVSPDNKFVYFCEQQSTADSCNSFIFDVVKNTIVYVTVDGTKLVTTGVVAKTATWSEKGLTIEGKTSAEATAPAVLLAN